jgi:hypothetical protein
MPAAAVAPCVVVHGRRATLMLNVPLYCAPLPTSGSRRSAVQAKPSCV